MINKEKRGIDYNKIKIIQTSPKMTETERERTEKMIGNDLYEVFSRMYSQLKS